MQPFTVQRVAMQPSVAQLDSRARVHVSTNSATGRLFLLPTISPACVWPHEASTEALWSADTCGGGGCYGWLGGCYGLVGWLVGRFAGVRTRNILHLLHWFHHGR
jgi:hypothetical protein